MTTRRADPRSADPSWRADAAPGDVLILPFPYSDRLAEKRRPALMVSDAALVARAQLVWVVMITSARNTPWADDVAIDDLDAAGLPAASVIRPVKIACVEPARVLRRAGRVDAATLARVRAALAETLALPAGAPT